MMQVDTVLHGDALEVLKGIPDNYVHSIVCDPPAGINFMSKDFDKDRGGRDQWIAWLRDIMVEAKRTLKPGGHALVWALPRTSHWTATALEDAGFEVRDAIFHHFGSGFPKSTAIDKQIDKMLGAEREVIGRYQRPDGSAERKAIQGWRKDYVSGDGGTLDGESIVSAPATPEAAQWAGYGTALKPSTEIWWLVRKPLAESSIAANVLAWNCGALNIDACRVGNENTVRQNHAPRFDGSHYNNGKEYNIGDWQSGSTQGRWPSHLLLSHSLWCIPQGVKRVRGNGPSPDATAYKSHDIYELGLKTNSPISYRDPDGYEQVEAYDCAPDCPIAELDRQSGVLHARGNTKPTKQGVFFASQDKSDFLGPVNPGDQGGASRYFTNFPPDDYIPWTYQAKASRAERNAGCEGLPEVDRAGGVHLDNRRCIQCGKQQVSGSPCTCTNPEWEVIPRDTKQSNNHPCVKSLALMRWLIRLITPPGGIVLDCFLGSGSTAVAAIQEGMHFIGIEQDASYVVIADARIAHARQEARIAQARREPAWLDEVAI